MPVSDLPDAESAFLRYEAVRPRLPTAIFPAAPVMAATLADVADRWVYELAVCNVTVAGADTR